jgi:hypothetical protein
MSYMESRNLTLLFIFGEWAMEHAVIFLCTQMQLQTVMLLLYNVINTLLLLHNF